MGITYGDHLIDIGYRELTPDQEDEIACPACGGVGWQKQWPGSRQEPPPDCTVCDGSGGLTREQAEAYFDRLRG